MISKVNIEYKENFKSKVYKYIMLFCELCHFKKIRNYLIKKMVDSMYKEVKVGNK